MFRLNKACWLGKKLNIYVFFNELIFTLKLIKDEKQKGYLFNIYNIIFNIVTFNDFKVTFYFYA